MRVRHFRRTGRWIGRVHILTRPLTEYLRYEFAVYRHTVKAGEDVRILDLTRQPDPGLPSQDFWLFDESAVVRMDYRPDGTQVGRELLEDIDPGESVITRYLLKELLDKLGELLGEPPGSCGSGGAGCLPGGQGTGAAMGVLLEDPDL